jgi:CBS domain-containing protein
MKIQDIMTRQVVTASPQDSVQSVARLMADSGTGAIPIEVPGVGKVVGFVTDRDVVIRIVAPGLSSSTTAAEIMTVGVESCRADDDVVAVAERMRGLHVKRLIVYDADRKLVGIVSAGDIAQHRKDGPDIPIADRRESRNG